jgi:hypothetical protein
LPRHREPFDAACGVAQDELLLRSSAAIQYSGHRKLPAWIAESLRSSR